MSDNKNAANKDSDPELDDLLDSALQDMRKNAEDKPADEGTNELTQNMWSEDFIKEAAAQFETNMSAILSNFSGVPEDQITQEQIAQTFTKMAEAAAHVLKPEGASVTASDAPPSTDSAEQEKIDEVSAVISEALKNLNTNTENLQTTFSEEDFTNMFNSFNFGEGGQDTNMFIPFMQGMMQSLLSKEVLYPSLKELVDKYPTWLAENKSKIDQTEYKRFEQQEELMKQVCAELEPEQETDSEDVKKKRFDKVLELMQKMQDLGQPPTELVGDIAAPPQGFVSPSGTDFSQCSLI